MGSSIAPSKMAMMDSEDSIDRSIYRTDMLDDSYQINTVNYHKNLFYTGDRRTNFKRTGLNPNGGGAVWYNHNRMMPLPSPMRNQPPAVSNIIRNIVEAGSRNFHNTRSNSNLRRTSMRTTINNHVDEVIDLTTPQEPRYNTRYAAMNRSNLIRVESPYQEFTFSDGKLTCKRKVEEVQEIDSDTSNSFNENTILKALNNESYSLNFGTPIAGTRNLSPSMLKRNLKCYRKIYHDPQNRPSGGESRVREAVKNFIELKMKNKVLAKKFGRTTITVDSDSDDTFPDNTANEENNSDIGININPFEINSPNLAYNLTYDILNDKRTAMKARERVTLSPTTGNCYKTLESPQKIEEIQLKDIKITCLANGQVIELGKPYNISEVPMSCETHQNPPPIVDPNQDEFDEISDSQQYTEDITYKNQHVDNEILQEEENYDCEDLDSQQFSNQITEIPECSDNNLVEYDEEYEYNEVTDQYVYSEETESHQFEPNETEDEQEYYNYEDMDFQQYSFNDCTFGEQYEANENCDDQEYTDNEIINMRQCHNDEDKIIEDYITYETDYEEYPSEEMLDEQENLPVVNEDSETMIHEQYSNNTTGETETDRYATCDVVITEQDDLQQYLNKANAQRKECKEMIKTKLYVKIEPMKSRDLNNVHISAYEHLSNIGQYSSIDAMNVQKNSVTKTTIPGEDSGLGVIQCYNEEDFISKQYSDGKTPEVESYTYNEEIVTDIIEHEQETSDEKDRIDKNEECTTSEANMNPCSGKEITKILYVSIEKMKTKDQQHVNTEIRDVQHDYKSEVTNCPISIDYQDNSIDIIPSISKDIGTFQKCLTDEFTKSPQTSSELESLDIITSQQYLVCSDMKVDDKSNNDIEDIVNLENDGINKTHIQNSCYEITNMPKCSNDKIIEHYDVSSHANEIRQDTKFLRESNLHQYSNEKDLESKQKNDGQKFQHTVNKELKNKPTNLRRNHYSQQHLENYLNKTQPYVKKRLMYSQQHNVRKLHRKRLSNMQHFNNKNMKQCNSKKIMHSRRYCNPYTGKFKTMAKYPNRKNIYNQNFKTASAQHYLIRGKKNINSKYKSNFINSRRRTSNRIIRAEQYVNENCNDVQSRSFDEDTTQGEYVENETITSLNNFQCYSLPTLHSESQNIDAICSAGNDVDITKNLNTIDVQIDNSVAPQVEGNLLEDTDYYSAWSSAQTLEIDTPTNIQDFSEVLVNIPTIRHDAFYKSSFNLIDLTEISDSEERDCELNFDMNSINQIPICTNRENFVDEFVESQFGETSSSSPSTTSCCLVKEISPEIFENSIETPPKQYPNTEIFEIEQHTYNEEYDNKGNLELENSSNLIQEHSLKFDDICSNNLLPIRTDTNVNNYQETSQIISTYEYQKENIHEEEIANIEFLEMNKNLSFSEIATNIKYANSLIRNSSFNSDIAVQLSAQMENEFTWSKDFKQEYLEIHEEDIIEVPLTPLVDTNTVGISSTATKEDSSSSSLEISPICQPTHENADLNMKGVTVPSLNKLKDLNVGQEPQHERIVLKLHKRKSSTNSSLTQFEITNKIEENVHLYNRTEDFTNNHWPSELELRNDISSSSCQEESEEETTSSETERINVDVESESISPKSDEKLLGNTTESDVSDDTDFQRDNDKISSQISGDNKLKIIITVPKGNIPDVDILLDEEVKSNSSTNSSSESIKSSIMSEGLLQKWKDLYSNNKKHVKKQCEKKSEQTTLNEFGHNNLMKTSSTIAAFLEVVIENVKEDDVQSESVIAVLDDDGTSSIEIENDDFIFHRAVSGDLTSSIKENDLSSTCPQVVVIDSSLSEKSSSSNESNNSKCSYISISSEKSSPYSNESSPATKTDKCIESIRDTKTSKHYNIEKLTCVSTCENLNQSSEFINSSPGKINEDLTKATKAQTSKYKTATKKLLLKKKINKLKKPFKIAANKRHYRKQGGTKLLNRKYKGQLKKSSYVKRRNNSRVQHLKKKVLNINQNKELLKHPNDFEEVIEVEQSRDNLTSEATLNVLSAHHDDCVKLEDHLTNHDLPMPHYSKSVQELLLTLKQPYVKLERYVEYRQSADGEFKNLDGNQIKLNLKDKIESKNNDYDRLDCNELMQLNRKEMCNEDILRIQNSVESYQNSQQVNSYLESINTNLMDPQHNNEKSVNKKKQLTTSLETIIKKLHLKKLKETTWTLEQIENNEPQQAQVNNTKILLSDTLVQEGNAEISKLDNLKVREPSRDVKTGIQGNVKECEGNGCHGNGFEIIVKSLQPQNDEKEKMQIDITEKQNGNYKSIMNKEQDNLNPSQNVEMAVEEYDNECEGNGCQGNGCESVLKPLQKQNKKLADENQNNLNLLESYTMKEVPTDRTVLEKCHGNGCEIEIGQIQLQDKEKENIKNDMALQQKDNYKKRINREQHNLNLVDDFRTEEALMVTQVSENECQGKGCHGNGCEIVVEQVHSQDIQKGMVLKQNDNYQILIDKDQNNLKLLQKFKLKEESKDIEVIMQKNECYGNSCKVVLERLKPQNNQKEIMQKDISLMLTDKYENLIDKDPHNSELPEDFEIKVPLNDTEMAIEGNINQCYGGGCHGNGCEVSVEQQLQHKRKETMQNDVLLEQKDNYKKRIRKEQHNLNLVEDFQMKEVSNDMVMVTQASKNECQGNGCHGNGCEIVVEQVQPKDNLKQRKKIHVLLEQMDSYGKVINKNRSNINLIEDLKTREESNDIEIALQRNENKCHGGGWYGKSCKVVLQRLELQNYQNEKNQADKLLIQKDGYQKAIGKDQINIKSVQKFEPKEDSNNAKLTKQESENECHGNGCHDGGCEVVEEGKNETNILLKQKDVYKRIIEKNQNNLNSLGNLKMKDPSIEIKTKLLGNNNECHGNGCHGNGCEVVVKQVFSLDNSKEKIQTDTLLSQKDIYKQRIGRQKQKLNSIEDFEMKEELNEVELIKQEYDNKCHDNGCKGSRCEIVADQLQSQNNQKERISEKNSNNLYFPQSKMKELSKDIEIVMQTNVNSSDDEECHGNGCEAVIEIQSSNNQKGRYPKLIDENRNNLSKLSRNMELNNIKVSLNKIDEESLITRDHLDYKDNPDSYIYNKARQLEHVKPNEFDSKLKSKPVYSELKYKDIVLKPLYINLTRIDLVNLDCIKKKESAIIEKEKSEIKEGKIIEPEVNVELKQQNIQYEKASGKTREYTINQNDIQSEHSHYMFSKHQKPDTLENMCNVKKLEIDQEEKRIRLLIKQAYRDIKRAHVRITKADADAAKAYFLMKQTESIIMQKDVNIDQFDLTEIQAIDEIRASCINQPDRESVQKDFEEQPANMELIKESVQFLELNKNNSESQINLRPYDIENKDAVNVTNDLYIKQTKPENILNIGRNYKHVMQENDLLSNTITEDHKDEILDDEIRILNLKEIGTNTREIMESEIKSLSSQISLLLPNDSGDIEDEFIEIVCPVTYWESDVTHNNEINEKVLKGEIGKKFIQVYAKEFLGSIYQEKEELIDEDYSVSSEESDIKIPETVQDYFIQMNLVLQENPDMKLHYTIFPVKSEENDFKFTSMNKYEAQEYLNLHVNFISWFDALNQNGMVLSDEDYNVICLEGSNNKVNGAIEDGIENKLLLRVDLLAQIYRFHQKEKVLLDENFLSSLEETKIRGTDILINYLNYLKHVYTLNRNIMKFDIVSSLTAKENDIAWTEKVEEILYKPSEKTLTDKASLVRIENDNTKPLPQVDLLCACGIDPRYETLNNKISPIRSRDIKMDLGSEIFDQTVMKFTNEVSSVISKDSEIKFTEMLECEPQAKFLNNESPLAFEESDCEMIDVIEDDRANKIISQIDATQYDTIDRSVIKFIDIISPLVSEESDSEINDTTVDAREKYSVSQIDSLTQSDIIDHMIRKSIETASVLTSDESDIEIIDFTEDGKEKKIISKIDSLAQPDIIDRRDRKSIGSVSSVTSKQSDIEIINEMKDARENNIKLQTDSLPQSNVIDHMVRKSIASDSPITSEGSDIEIIDSTEDDREKNIALQTDSLTQSDNIGHMVRKSIGSASPITSEESDIEIIDEMSDGRENNIALQTDSLTQSDVRDHKVRKSIASASPITSAESDIEIIDSTEDDRQKSMTLQTDSLPQSDVIDHMVRKSIGGTSPLTSEESDIEIIDEIADAEENNIALQTDSLTQSDTIGHMVRKSIVSASPIISEESDIEIIDSTEGGKEKYIVSNIDLLTQTKMATCRNDIKSIDKVSSLTSKESDMEMIKSMEDAKKDNVVSQTDLITQIDIIDQRVRKSVDSVSSLSSEESDIEVIKTMEDARETSVVSKLDLISQADTINRRNRKSLSSDSSLTSEESDIEIIEMIEDARENNVLSQNNLFTQADNIDRRVRKSIESIFSLTMEESGIEIIKTMDDVTEKSIVSQHSSITQIDSTDLLEENIDDGVYHVSAKESDLKIIESVADVVQEKLVSQMILDEQNVKFVNAISPIEIEGTDMDITDSVGEMTINRLLTLKESSIKYTAMEIDLESDREDMKFMDTVSADSSKEQVVLTDIIENEFEAESKTDLLLHSHNPALRDVNARDTVSELIDDKIEKDLSSKDNFVSHSHTLIQRSVNYINTVSITSSKESDIFSELIENETEQHITAQIDLVSQSPMFHQQNVKIMDRVSSIGTDILSIENQDLASQINLVSQSDTLYQRDMIPLDKVPLAGLVDDILSENKVENNLILQSVVKSQLGTFDQRDEKFTYDTSNILTEIMDDKIEDELTIQNYVTPQFNTFSQSDVHIVRESDLLAKLMEDGIHQDLLQIEPQIHTLDHKAGDGVCLVSSKKSDIFTEMIENEIELDLTLQNDLESHLDILHRKDVKLISPYTSNNSDILTKRLEDEIEENLTLQSDLKVQLQSLQEDAKLIDKVSLVRLNEGEDAFNKMIENEIEKNLLLQTDLESQFHFPDYRDVSFTDTVKGLKESEKVIESIVKELESDLILQLGLESPLDTLDQSDMMLNDKGSLLSSLESDRDLIKIIEDEIDQHLTSQLDILGQRDLESIDRISSGSSNESDIVLTELIDGEAENNLAPTINFLQRPRIFHKKQIKLIDKGTDASWEDSDTDISESIKDSTQEKQDSHIKLISQPDDLDKRKVTLTDQRSSETFKEGGVERSEDDIIKPELALQLGFLSLTNNVDKRKARLSDSINSETGFESNIKLSKTAEYINQDFSSRDASFIRQEMKSIDRDDFESNEEIDLTVTKTITDITQDKLTPEIKLLENTTFSEQKNVTMNKVHSVIVKEREPEITETFLDVVQEKVARQINLSTLVETIDKDIIKFTDRVCLPRLQQYDKGVAEMSEHIIQTELESLDFISEAYTVDLSKDKFSNKISAEDIQESDIEITEKIPDTGEEILMSEIDLLPEEVEVIIDRISPSMTEQNDVMKERRIYSHSISDYGDKAEPKRIDGHLLRSSEESDIILVKSFEDIIQENLLIHTFKRQLHIETRTKSTENIHADPSVLPSIPPILLRTSKSAPCLLLGSCSPLRSSYFLGLRRSLSLPTLLTKFGNLPASVYTPLPLASYIIPQYKRGSGHFD